jgi:hypothetical protein
MMGGGAMPKSEDGFEEVQALLKAEAERRGITVEELTDELARSGRRSLEYDLIVPGGLRPDDQQKRSDHAMLRLIIDTDPQDDLP